MRLKYVTNSKYGHRSSNPGTVTGLLSFFGEIFIPQIIYYEAGYIKFSDGWYFVEKEYAEKDFKNTTAHELGHEIIKAFGGDVYSYGHKKTSNPVFQTPHKNTKYPESPKEIDLMIYANEDKPYDYFERSIVAKEDILGLVWLTNLLIK